jgi:hypothetical protein
VQIVAAESNHVKLVEFKKQKYLIQSRMQRYMPIIPALRRLGRTS